jgi:CRP-like cAMP-binding protein
MVGQLTFAAYNLGQATILWPSVAWSGLFASVNASKIYDIFHERNADVHMSEEQENVFVEYFMPHGVTPKQFERIEEKATKVLLKKGDFLIRKGDMLNHLYLVVDGSTHAHILGRRVTAASTSPVTRGDQLEGGDSGAWVGELTFLDKLWDFEQGNMRQQYESRDEKDMAKSPKLGLGISMYTIVADDDCIVMSWSHDEIADLMESSTDLRAALTRAMTSAVVGKVVNLTVSHSEPEMPRWSSWLSEWKNGARVQVRDAQKLLESQS